MTLDSGRGRVPLLQAPTTARRPARENGWLMVTRGKAARRPYRWRWWLHIAAMCADSDGGTLGQRHGARTGRRGGRDVRPGLSGRAHEARRRSASDSRSRQRRAAPPRSANRSVKMATARLTHRPHVMEISKIK
jgi:hypothetical protein